MGGRPFVPWASRLAPAAEIEYLKNYPQIGKNANPKMESAVQQSIFWQ